MRLLRGTLYLHAGLWFGLGVLLALGPRTLQSWFDQPPYVEHAWVRVVGILLVGTALHMVLVAHRVEELWWWCWGFVLTGGAVAGVLTLNAAFGVPPRGGGAVWWALALGQWALASSVLVGMQRASRERPTDRYAPAPARDPHPERRKR